MDIIMDVNQGCEILERESEIGYDCETTGLSPWRDRIALMQFCGRESKIPVVIQIHDGNVPRRVMSLFEQGSRLFVGHNVGQFDVLFLDTHGVKWKNSRWYDTLIGEGLISTTSRRDVSRNLKNSIRRRLGLEIDKDIEHGHWQNATLSEKQLEYAANDVMYLIALMDEQVAKATQQGQLEALEMETDLMKLVSQMTLNGMPIRKERLDDWLDEQREKLVKCQQWVRQEFGQINMNSWKQKIAAAESKGVYLPDTKAETLAEIARLGTGYASILAQNFLDYSEPAQRLRMYGEEWQGLYIIDGWAHPRFWQTGTDTLRFSSTNPNFQQIPKDGRKIIGNLDGYKIVSADFSQIEVRIAAEISRDSKLIGILKEGDVHTKVAAEIYRVPESEITPEMRKHAKAATFTLIFGGGHERLQSYAKMLGSPMTTDEAYTIFTRFFESFSGLYEMRKRAYAERGKRVVTITFPNSAKRTLIGRNVTPQRILNTMVQGPAAVGMKYSILEAEKNGIMKYIGSTVHDELVAVVPEREVKEVATLMEKSMIDGMHRAFPNMLVKVEVKIGDNWQA